MALSKLLCCISTLVAGCCVKQNAIEFAEVAGKSGVVSATLGAFDSSGVLHINLNEGITILQGAVYFYGIKEDASFMRSELFDELKEIAINTPMLGSIAGSTAFDETPLFDGERCWYNYGGSILPVSRLTHGDEDGFNREKMKNIPIESLDKCFDCSGGYHEIGYIVVAISYKDVEGVESVDFIILNRVGLRRLVAREVTFEEKFEVVPLASTAFQRIAKVKDSVLRVEELGDDIGRIKADLELIPGYCMTNQCGSFRQMDGETKRQIDREYKLLRAKLFDISERLDEIETRMENYGNLLAGELLRQKMKNGELANGQECLGWTALDFVEATNKTSGIQQRVAYPLGTGCPSVVLELSQGGYCFNWYHESGNSTLYKADTNQNLAVMLKLFPGKGKQGGLMTRHFEKWRWKQFKKSDLKDGECYVVLDGENVFVNRPSEPWRHDLPNTESFSEVGK